LAVEEAFGTCALEEACTFDSGIVDASSSSAGLVAAFGLALAQPSAVPFEVAGEALVAELDLKEIVLAKVPGCKPIVCLQKLVALTAAAAAVVVLVVVAVVDVQTAVVFDEAGKLWMHHFELALVVFVVSAAAPVASLAFVAFAVVVASSAAASFGMLAFVVVAFEEALAVVVEFVEAFVVVVAFEEALAVVVEFVEALVVVVAFVVG